MRLRSPLSLALVAGLAALACAERAPLPPRGAAAAARAEAVTVIRPAGLARLESLLVLPGDAVTIRYTPGTLDRAAHVQRRLETLAELFALLSKRPQTLEAWVLAREDWEAAALERAYGLPLQVGPAAFAIPGWGDDAQVGAIESLLGEPAPELDGVPLRGTAREGGALQVADAILQIEASRDFAERAGLRGDAPWVDGLLAQWVARLAFERFEPGRMPQIARLFDAFAMTQGGPRALRLEDFVAGLPLAIDLWYQAQFLRGADQIWVEKGERASSRWLYRRIERQREVTAAELEQEFPGLVEWRRASFAR